MKYKIAKRGLTLILLVLLLITQKSASLGLAAVDINFVIDGNKVNIPSPQPFIQDGRVLVPLRFVAEQLGAEVVWNDNDMTAHIQKDNHSVILQIDSHLIEYDIDGKTYNISDVAPFIVEERTFVPLRILSNGLGVSIDWDDIERTVNIDTLKLSDITPLYDLHIDTIEPGQRISGKTLLQVSSQKGRIIKADVIKFLLLNPDTRRGVVVARGEDITGEYTWLPDMKQTGNKVLVAALYDKDGAFLAGSAIPVKMAV